MLTARLVRPEERKPIKKEPPIKVVAKKDDVNDEIVYYINILKKENNGNTSVFYVGRKTELEYYHLLNLLDFLNVRYEVHECWIED